MPQCCAVPFCSEKKGGHMFPRDPTVLKQWLVAIRKNNFTPSKHARVCKKHFNPEDYMLPRESNTENPIPRLKPKVVPSQFSWNQESEERKEIKRKRAERAHRRQEKKLGTATLSSNTEKTQVKKHFLQNDMKNYVQYKIIGTLKRVRMIPNCVPSKFVCQRTPSEQPHEIETELNKKSPTTISTSLFFNQGDHSSGSIGSSARVIGDSNEALEPTCSLCRKAITGFLFLCVQCDVRVCGACDARGPHAAHYVLRAPSGKNQKELKTVMKRVCEAISSAGLTLAQSAPPAQEHEWEQDSNNSDFELKTEIKLEIDEQEDPLGSGEYEELDPSTAAAADTSGSQVVPDEEVKSEPPEPDTSTAILRSTSPAISSPESSRRQSVASSPGGEDIEPLAKRKRQLSDTATHSVTSLKHTDRNKTPDKRKSTSNPNADPGSPSSASSLIRLKKE